MSFAGTEMLYDRVGELGGQVNPTGLFRREGESSPYGGDWWGLNIAWSSGFGGGALSQAVQAELNKISKHDKMNDILHAQVANAFWNMSVQCSAALTAAGIDLNQAAIAASDTQYYNASPAGAGSTLPAEGYRLVNAVSGNTTYGTMTLTQYVGASPAAALYDADGNIANQVVLGASYFTQGAVGQNVTLLHEALHTYTNLDDIQLAQKLGLGLFASVNDASDVISGYLAPVGTKFGSGGVVGTNCSK